MQYKATINITCFYSLPTNQDRLEISGVKFLSKDENRRITHIQTMVEAQNKEEATKVVREKVLPIIHLLAFRTQSVWEIDNLISWEYSAQTPGVTTASSSFRLVADIIGPLEKIDVSKEEHFLVNDYPDYQIPFALYAQAQSTTNDFLKFLFLYQILEYYEETQEKINAWIKQRDPTNVTCINKKGKTIYRSVYTDIRNGIGHKKRSRPSLLPMNSDDVQKVRQHLPGIEKLAMQMIQEKLNI